MSMADTETAHSTHTNAVATPSCFKKRFCRLPIALFISKSLLSLHITVFNRTSFYVLPVNWFDSYFMTTSLPICVPRSDSTVYKYIPDTIAWVFLDIKSHQATELVSEKMPLAECSITRTMSPSRV